MYCGCVPCEGSIVHAPRDGWRESDGDWAHVVGRCHRSSEEDPQHLRRVFDMMCRLRRDSLPRPLFFVVVTRWREVPSK